MQLRSRARRELPASVPRGTFFARDFFLPPTIPPPFLPLILHIDCSRNRPPFFFAPESRFPLSAPTYRFPMRTLTLDSRIPPFLPFSLYAFPSGEVPSAPHFLMGKHTVHFSTYLARSGTSLGRLKDHLGPPCVSGGVCNEPPGSFGDFLGPPGGARVPPTDSKLSVDWLRFVLTKHVQARFRKNPSASRTPLVNFGTCSG